MTKATTKAVTKKGTAKKGKIGTAAKKVVRGIFLSAMDLAQRYRDSYYGDHTQQEIFKEGRSKIALTYHELANIGEKQPCPCGHCNYYTVELLKDGIWRSYHTSKGLVVEGNYKTGEMTYTPAGRALGLAY